MVSVSENSPGCQFLLPVLSSLDRNVPILTSIEVSLYSTVCDRSLPYRQVSLVPHPFHHFVEPLAWGCDRSLLGMKFSILNRGALAEGISQVMDPTGTTLTKVFRDVFDDETITLRSDLSANDIPDWDSLTHIRLLFTIEREFRIKFTITEVGDLKNVGELIALIQSKTAKASPNT